MARYYRRFGFTFFTDRSAALTEMTYALDTDIDALNTLPRPGFPGVDLADEAALMRDPELYGRSPQARRQHRSMRPMVEFAARAGQPGRRGHQPGGAARSRATRGRVARSPGSSPPASPSHRP